MVPDSVRPAWVSRLFGRGGSQTVDCIREDQSLAHRWEGTFLKDRVTVGGSIRARLDFGNPNIIRYSVELLANPTRTFMHLGCPSLDVAAATHPTEFFAANPDVARAVRALTLDGSDNYAHFYSGLGGDAGWREWLALFERQLMLLLEWIFHPPTPEHGEPDLPGVHGELSWSNLTLSEVEAYVERRAENAVDLSVILAQGLVTAAREAETTAYYLARQGRRSAALSTVLPLTEDVGLSVYAKTSSRVRFEVRYRDYSFSTVRARAEMVGRGEASGPLQALFILAARDASSRLPLPWRFMAEAAVQPERDVASTLAEFAQLVHRACRGEPSYFEAVFARLLRTGAVSSGGADAFAPVGIVEALLRLGVLRRARLLLSERDDGGRVFSLAPRFLGMRRLIGLGAHHPLIHAEDDATE